MSSVISAIGTATPPFRFSQKEVLKFMIEAHQTDDREAARLTKIYEVSGIEQRHSVVSDFNSAAGIDSLFSNGFPSTAQRGSIYEEQAVQIGKQAIENLFTTVRNLIPAQITHLITVSCTGMYAPGLDIDLIEQLGLNKSAERLCINFMGCYGAFNALKTADYICRAQPAAKVLIADVELCTLHFQKENTLNNWVANSLFADGAAAVLVEGENSRSTTTAFRLQTFYNLLVLEGKKEMSWRIGDVGFQMHLSSQIARNIKGKIGEVTNKVLSLAKLSVKDVSRFAVHPGGRRILEVCEEALHLPEEVLEHSYDVLKKFGNMSSTTVLFVLQRLLQKAERGEKVMSFAFGPGLTFESMILETV
jgi:predicted naringenin-chalcone synthase